VTNLVVSSACNRQCTYCFTLDQPGPGRRFLSLPAFNARLEFLDRSGIDHVRLLGGEPTLHPRFPELVSRARRAGKAVTIFSNGLMPPPSLACLEALPTQECTVVVNVTPAGSATTLERQRQTLRRLGKRAMPGLNLYRTDLEPGFVLDLVAETGCRPAVRLSMAHPVLSGRNRFIHPGQYRAIAVRIASLARPAAQAGVRLEFDCGFVRCMFSTPEIEALQEAGADVGWRCNPILDLDLEGRALHCLPLAGLVSLAVAPDACASALRSELEALVRPYRQAGVYRECSTCTFKATGECSGGCLAATIRRFRQVPFRLEVPAREEGGRWLPG
jgi:uncharacterized Fe-S cluster-containing radical SAM superfamily protein